MENNTINEIEELKSIYYTAKDKLFDKIKSYIIDILKNFKDNYIEFQPCNGWIFDIDEDGMELKSISLKENKYNVIYVEISFIDNYDNEHFFMIEDMDVDIYKCECILDAITEYIDKYGYKHIEEI